jgi:hypothetical protein
METPWGWLQDIDSSSKSVAFDILSTDKDTLLEGLVVESTFERMLAPLYGSHVQEGSPSAGSAASNVPVFLDVETAIGGTRMGRVAFVWARSPTPGLRRYLIALGNLMPVVLVKLINGTFFTREVIRATGKLCGEARPLQEIAAHISRNKAKVREVDLSVRDANRQNETFWGHLSGVYKDKLWSHVVLPRIFMNHGISPYFPRVWNLDRVCLYRDELWLFEVKHKFPYGGRNLRFGINEGELENIALLHQAGIRCLHTLLVKPIWKGDQGSMYLYNDRDLQHRVAIIATELGGIASSLLEQQRATAPAKTSVGGRNPMSFLPLDLQRFSWIGTLEQTNVELAETLKLLMDKKILPIVDEQRLRQLQVERSGVG